MKPKELIKRVKNGESVYLNADCMDYLNHFENGFFDLAITDPPYSYNSGNAFTGRLKRYGKLDFNNEQPTKEYFNRLIKCANNSIIWGGNYFIDNLNSTKCLITWYKHQPVITYADSEIAWTNFNSHSKVFDYPYFGATGSENHRYHPNQKPKALYRWLCQNYAKPGDIILDTHVGSANSLAVYEELGFQYVGFEKDTDYYNDSLKNIKDHMAYFKNRPKEMLTDGTQLSIYDDKL